MDPVTTFLLVGLLGTVAVEGSVGAVKGAIQALRDADTVPGQLAAAAFAICFVTLVGLGLVALHPVQVAIFLRNIRAIPNPFGFLVRDLEDPAKPRSIKMDVAKETLKLVSHMSPLAMTVLVVASLSAASVVFGITYLEELAEMILKTAGGAVQGAYSRIKKWVGKLDEP